MASGRRLQRPTSIFCRPGRASQPLCTLFTIIDLFYPEISLWRPQEPRYNPVIEGLNGLGMRPHQESLLFLLPAEFEPVPISMEDEERAAFEERLSQTQSSLQKAASTF